MSPSGNAVPEPQDGDSDAVVTALESAQIFHARGDLGEATRWLRRAVELASEDGHDARALHFARAAAELAPGEAGEPEPAVDPAAAAVEGPRAPVDDVMAELFDEPIAPAFKAKPRDAAPAVAVPQIPSAPPLPVIAEPPLLDAEVVELQPTAVIAEPPPPPPLPSAVAVVEAAQPARAAPPLPSPARPASEPPAERVPSSLPEGPPLRPSGIVSVTESPPPALEATTERNLKAAAPLDFDDKTPATVPHHEIPVEAARRTSVWAAQELLARSMTEDTPEPNQTWEDKTEAESTSAAWAKPPGSPLKSEPPPKPPKMRAPTVSKLDIEWEASSPVASSAPTVLTAAREAEAAIAASMAPSTREPAPAPALTLPKPAARVQRATPSRKALRGSLQATTEDGVFVFVPLSAHERPPLHTHEALIVLLNAKSTLDG